MERSSQPILAGFAALRRTDAVYISVFHLQSLLLENMPSSIRCRLSPGGQQAMMETKPEPEQEQPVARQTTIRVLIKSSGGKANIRTGNGTSYSRITAVAPGTTLEYVASAFNGWQAVKIGSQVGWVSGEFSEITSE